MIELIYIWIEKFRNLEQLGVNLTDEYLVKIDHIQTDKKTGISVKEIHIKKSKSKINIFPDHITNINAIVGKNSTGKSNILTCIGDLLTSFYNSSFILIYHNSDTNNYLLECNQIGIKNNTDILYATQSNFQPKTSIFVYDDGIIKRSNDQLVSNVLSKIEYITVREKTNDMLFPNANNLYSYIGRFGLSYDDSGLIYKFRYLSDHLNNSESFENNDIEIEIKLNYKTWERNKYQIKILPEYFPDKKCLFDYYGDEGRYIYKKTFMLRFLEVSLNNFRFVNDKLIECERKELLEIIDNCSNDIDNLIGQYSNIRQIIINIRTKLMNKNMENDIDIKLCYTDFIDKMEELIHLVSHENFKDSYTCKIRIAEIRNNSDIMERINQFLDMVDEYDISLEFLKSKLNIQFNNLSDGMRYLLHLYSTMHKCFKHNKINDYENVILILDEPETYMHPEWSRSLLSNIFRFLQKEFDKQNFHIILSTHSPFILSDIPNENIIFLEKDEQGKSFIKELDIKTFGANIHTLLKESFFMNSTIGEFSKSLIREVLEYLDSTDYSGDMYKEKAKVIINMIGENIIREKLNKIFLKRFPEEVEDVNLKIKYYQNEINELQSKLQENTYFDIKSIKYIQRKLEKTLDSINKIINESYGDEYDKD